MFGLFAIWIGDAPFIRVRPTVAVCCQGQGQGLKGLGAFKRLGPMQSFSDFLRLTYDGSQASTIAPLPMAAGYPCMA